MKRYYSLLLLFILLVLLNSFAAPAAAQDPGPAPTPSDNEVNAVAREMYCPVCENIPLDVCPTTACQEWRELIRLKLSEGYTEQEIKEYFASQYGDRVLAEPPRRGLNWLVYILPVVFFLAGSVILWNVFRSARAKPVPAADRPAVPAPEQDPYLKKVEEELRRQDE